jgi:hypothetical protein
MAMMFTAAERPDLWERGIDSSSVWPKSNLHGDVLNEWWGLLDVELADVRWRREDGQLLDPWMRVHERLGARIGAPLPESLLITGSLADWEAWTGMAFPESGAYVFPEGLAMVSIDRGADRGVYWEPNVWMIHPDVE